MRTILLKVHLYAGLLCSSYLILFGISSLNFNHHFGHPGTLRVERQRGLQALPAISDDQRLAEALRDTLGLVGWMLPWETSRSETTDSLYFRFAVSRPGKQYTVRVQSPKELVPIADDDPPPPPKKNAPSQAVKKEVPPPEPPRITLPTLREPAHRIIVDETGTGLWSIIGQLHGFSGNLPRAGFMRFWSAYTEICVWVVLFSLVSGVYLWAAQPAERLIGLILLGAGAGGGLLFMLAIWIWG
ncbi:MAG: hypothetical protein IT369_10980 [Candidatus Latescibacteria bacterium]|nr:hypothetical protein [Candidatus Latescibacterota bacterium]